MSPRTAKQYEEIRTDKRKQIMEAAVKLFAEKGFHAASISLIAKEAGISKGLIYNYFDSKETLLKEIMDELTTQVMDLMNPDHDDEITSQEMEDFFSLIIKLLKDNHEHWKLYFQLSMKKDVFEIIQKDYHSDRIQKSQALIYKYFSERFTNPQLEMFVFSSIFKGFAMQYVYAPEMFPDEIIDQFKNRLINMFIKDKM
ncbi:MAG: TetR/AcrR family transcriptional regulator [Bacteroidales bacterium]|nr:TetR/AcrR family transcriptional regulator [Bacteroidales bacterium]